jgi:flavin reductase (DIM6/NTAB) family NADH-FMN oxidoreductase RutF
MSESRGMKTISMEDIPALLNPRLAVLVTCVDSKGRANIITVAWQSPLSHRPPLVGISIGKKRYSHQLIAETREYVINVMSMEQKEIVWICGSRSGLEYDKASLTGLSLQPGSYVKAPVIKEALGFLECRLVEQYEVGDHTLFVGEVLHAEAAAAYFTDVWETGRARVLLSLRGERFVTVAPEK